MYNDGEFSVDPTEDSGVYDGAAYLKLWLKCEDSISAGEGRGTSDSSGNNHHAADNGNGIALANDSPTATNIDNEY